MSNKTNADKCWEAGCSDYACVRKGSCTGAGRFEDQRKTPKPTRKLTDIAKANNYADKAGPMIKQSSCWQIARNAYFAGLRAGRRERK